MFKEQYFLSYFTVFVFLLKLGKRDMSKNPNLSSERQFHRGVLLRGKKPQIKANMKLSRHKN